MSDNFKKLKRIADIVANHYDVHVMSMFPNSRYQVDADRRQVFHYMATRHTRASLQEIGDFSKAMGRKKVHNHATVLHSVKIVTDYMHVDKAYRMEVKELENKIYKAVILINDSSKVRVFEEDNIEYLELVHLLIKKIYENKNIEELTHLIFLQNKMNNERIYKASQNDSRLGMV